MPPTPPSGSELLACLGAILIIICYWRVQWHRDYAKRVMFSLLNLVAGLCLLGYVIHNGSLIYIVTDAIWIFISCYGLHRCIKYLRLQREQKRWLASRNSKR